MTNAVVTKGEAHMTPEAKEMMKILQNLENAKNKTQVAQQTSTSSESAPTGNVSPDAQEMYNILHKLQNATEESAKSLVKESTQVQTKPVEESGFGFGNLNVVMRKANVYGYKKTFYTVMEGDEVIAEELALFESAMGIIKNVLGKNDNNKTRRIIDLDEQYSIRFDDAAQHKQRAKTIKESVKQDVAMAKHSVAVDKMRSIKQQIQKLI